MCERIGNRVEIDAAWILVFARPSGWARFVGSSCDQWSVREEDEKGRAPLLPSLSPLNYSPSSLKHKVGPRCFLSFFRPFPSFSVLSVT